MISRQERFEDAVILESDLGRLYNIDGDEMELTLDTMGSGYKTLQEIVSEYGKDIDFEMRKFLYIILYERFNRLDDLDRRIAELKYIHGRTLQEISKEVGKSKTAVFHRLKGINNVIRSI
jgi:DNA-directed RNA polymerase specialized sigma subunit